MTELVIFDLDGTLLNTLDDLADTGNHVLSAHGFPTHPVEAYRYFVGNGVPTLVRRMLPAAFREGGVHRRCTEEFLAYYRLHMYDKTREYKGMTETLEGLRADGLRIAVATNKVQEAVGPLMDRYFPGVTFDVLCGQRPGMPPKPDPEVVFEILKLTGCTKPETLYVGDTAVDMDTAHRAGLAAAGALWGYRTKTELEAARADCLVASPHELLETVRRANAGRRSRNAAT